MVDFTKMSRTDTINVHFVPKEPRINSDILQLPDRIKEECDLENLNKAEIMRLLTIGTLTDEDGDLITLEAINGSIPQVPSNPSDNPDKPGEGEDDPEQPGEGGEDGPEDPGEDPGEDPENPGEGGEDPEDPEDPGEDPENPGEGGGDEEPEQPNPPSGGGGGLIWEDLGDLLG